MSDEKEDDDEYDNEDFDGEDLDELSDEDKDTVPISPMSGAETRTTARNRRRSNTGASVSSTAATAASGGDAFEANVISELAAAANGSKAVSFSRASGSMCQPEAIRPDIKDKREDLVAENADTPAPQVNCDAAVDRNVNQASTAESLANDLGEVDPIEKQAAHDAMEEGEADEQIMFSVNEAEGDSVGNIGIKEFSNRADPNVALLSLPSFGHRTELPSRPYTVPTLSCCRAVSPVCPSWSSSNTRRPLSEMNERRKPSAFSASLDDETKGFTVGKIGIKEFNEAGLQKQTPLANIADSKKSHHLLPLARSGHCRKVLSRPCSVPSFSLEDEQKMKHSVSQVSTVATEEDCVSKESESFVLKRHSEKPAVHGKTLAARRRDFEGKENAETFEERMRNKVLARRDSAPEVSTRFLEWMKEKGDGSITIAWRRHFDSNGDGDLSFIEFCNALASMKYEVDTVKLWHQFGGGLDHTRLTLDALDPEGNEILEFFAIWCKDIMGGPMEVFTYMDADHSDSLEPEELSEGLRDLGFFDYPGLPSLLDNEEKVMKHLYPLLDARGGGCVQSAEILFLEKDPEKRSKHLKDIARRHSMTGGKSSEEAKLAEELLQKVCMRETQLGGKFWKMIPENNVLPTSVTSSRASSTRTTPLSLQRTLHTDPYSPKSPAIRTSSKRLHKAQSTAPKCFPNFASQKVLPADVNLPVMASGPLGRLMESSPSVLSSTASTLLPSATTAGGSLAASSSTHLPAVDECPVKPLVPCDRPLLSVSRSLPQLASASPEFSSKLRRSATKKNNEAVRSNAKRHMRSSRAKYGGGLVTPLPPVNPKDPFKPAKANLILPEYRLKSKQTRGENFHAENSVSFDFFRSCKGHSLLDHYYV